MVDFELNHLKIADLSLGADYWGPLQTLLVKPVELEHLVQPWTCHKTWRVVRDEADVTPFYTITISILGTLKNQEQVRELESLCDKLCLPIYHGDDRWTSPDPTGGSSGGSIPEIKMVKKFGGEFSSNAEQRLKELYETVKKIVLQHRITEDFSLETTGYSWADTIQRVYREKEMINAPSMAEYIASSTLQKQIVYYAPSAQIHVIIPDEKTYPKYVYQGHHQGKEKFGISQVVDVLSVTARPEYIEPDIVVVSNYVWPGRK